MQQVNNPQSRRPSVFTATLLGALLLMTSQASDAQDRGERSGDPKASSVSRAKGSAAKSSSASRRSTPRSQPRASSPSRSSRSQPRASSRSQSRGSGSAARSSSSRSRKWDREARPSRRTLRTESSRSYRDKPAKPAIREVEPRRIERSPQGDAEAVDRTDRSGTRYRLTRPRYRTPSERVPGARSAERLEAVGERRGRIDRGDSDRHYGIANVDPGDSRPRSVEPPQEGRRLNDRDHEHGHHGGYYGHRRHRHHYGCGHYGYGYDRYRYDRYRYDRYRHRYGYDRYGFSYYSPYFYLGLGGWGPQFHVYSGSHRSSRYDDGGRQGALDLNIRPKDAEIYIDGAFVGVADQYDGFPSYLWLEEGVYEVAFYKKGYETLVREVAIYPGVTIDIGDRMQPGKAVLPTRPAAVYPAPEVPPSSAGVAPTAGGTSPSTGAAPGSTAVDTNGRIAIMATPSDAAVYLDSHFVGTAEEIAGLSSGLIVEAGDHVVEIIRPGYENQRVPVSLAVGERIDLQLNLKQP